MLASCRMMGFVVTTDYDKARAFYEGRLGFEFVSLDQFALAVRAGENMLANNVGGEVHTFTPVRQYGGGFIPILNELSNNPVPAPECLDFSTMVLVPSGGKSIIPGAALAAVADADGIARVECCLHPWMRTDVRLR